MRRPTSSGFLLTFLAGVALSWPLLSCTGGREDGGRSDHPTVPPGTESILDRVVEIHPELITEIPDVPRWCDRLGLASRRIDVGGAELFVEEEGEGVPLVLINGGPGGTHHYFHPWFVRAAGFARVIYYDQRGCGLSDFEPGPEGYSVDQAVEDLDALRRGLGVERWVVLGFSYGGFLAQYYTIRHPESVAGLVLLGASPGISVGRGHSREQEFFSEEERARGAEIREQLQQLSKERDLSPREYLRLLVYNNFLNGDWKRQGFYKPSAERVAQIALYEWDHDRGFNDVMGRSQAGIDFEGVFDANPIPTLILEGDYDMTWSEDKAGILAANHPRARLATFDRAAHSIYDEQPDRFFEVLEEFVTTLPRIPPEEVSRYRNGLQAWEEELRQRRASPRFAVRASSWGWNSSRELAGEYSRDWLEAIDDTIGLLRLGFALYDVERYDDARVIFEALQAKADSDPFRAMALIWQGHMLDLIGRRDEAIERYRQAAEMNLENTWQHSQYGMRYRLSPYAAERMETPFERVTNRDPS